VFLVQEKKILEQQLEKARATLGFFGSMITFLDKQTLLRNWKTAVPD